MLKHINKIKEFLQNQHPSQLCFITYTDNFRTMGSIKTGKYISYCTGLTFTEEPFQRFTKGIPFVDLPFVINFNELVM